MGLCSDFERITLDARGIIREFHTLDSLKPEINGNKVENVKISFPAMRRIHPLSVARIKLLALFGVMYLVAVYSQNYTKHKSRPTFYVRNQWRM